MSRISILFVVTVLVLFPVCLHAQDDQTSQGAGGFVPKWTVGQQWTLQASYRDLKNVGQPWLTPIKWVFKVKAIKNLLRQDCYVLHVYPKDSSLKMQAVLYLAVRDLRTIRVIDVFPTAQGVKSRTRDVDPYHPEPLISENTMVPYDLPVFPLVRMNVQQADGFAGYAEPPAKTFNKVAAYGAFKFKRTVSQTGKQPDRRYADAFASYKSMATGQAFQVELADSGPGGQLTQLWQEGSPWAISGETSAKKVWLVPTLPSPTSIVAPNAPQGDEK
ncbi:MAG: hypothetical protein WA705_16190 [Candidatus Ozemobacteraceae bacterium]